MKSRESHEEKVEAFKAELLEILRNSRLPQSFKHAEDVKNWVLKLKPNADLAMELASWGHDLENCKEETRVKREDFDDEKTFKQAHAQKSSELLDELFRKYGLNEELITRTVHLVANHEHGVDEDSNTLMQSEAISFLGYNLPIYFLQKGEARTRDKIKTMWSKLSVKQQSTVRQLVSNYNKTLEDYSHIDEEDWTYLLSMIS